MMKLLSAYSWLGMTALIVGSSSGCSSHDYELAPVRGRIVQAEQPKGRLSVVFQPIASSADHPNPGPASYGVTDANGEYTLHTIDADRPGAVVGRHRVSIHVYQPETQSDADRNDPDAAIPRHFRDHSLTIDVPAVGLTNADFDLAAAAK
jgi:hypothetical protein